MEELGIVDLLDADTRATFVLDLNTNAGKEKWTIALCNGSLRKHPGLLDCICNSQDAAGFRSWSQSMSQQVGCYTYRSVEWTKFTIHGRWRVVCRTGVADYKTFDPIARLPSILTNESNISPVLSKHLECIRNVDWFSNPLGPMEYWPQDWLNSLTIVLLDPRPTGLLLGSENVLLYNVAYAELAGEAHPGMMAQPVRSAWHDAAENSVAAIAEKQAPGTGFIEEERQLFTYRNGYLEETYFYWGLIPLPGDVRGFYHPTYERTKEHLMRRRSSALLEASQLCAVAHDMKSFWSAVVKGLTPYGYDFPFIAAYSHVEDTLENDGIYCSRFCTLKETLGIPADSPTFPKILDLIDDTGLAPACRDAMRRGEPVFIRTEDGSLPEAIIDESSPRGFGDPCKLAVVCPMRATAEEDDLGFLIFGLNTRRPCDLDYCEWIATFNRSFGLAAAAVRESVKKSLHVQRLAAQEQEILTNALKLRTKESTQNEEKLQQFHKVAEMVDVGIFSFGTDGKLISANDSWYDISGHPKDPNTMQAFSFVNYVYPEDKELVISQWNRLIEGNPVTYEMRWNDSLASQGKWVLAACVPIIDADGHVTSISGCITDISAQKRSAQEAAQAFERAQSSETRFSRFAELAPIAIYMLNAEGKLTFANHKWFEMSGHPKVPLDEVVWENCILEEDLASVRQDFEKMVVENVPKSMQFRVKRIWESAEGQRCHGWILALAYPERGPDGSVEAVMGTMTEISHLKWAENVQTLRAEEAMQQKRNTENFIDMTSHEMRNPLNAMLLSADSITSALKEIANIVESQYITTSTNASERLVHIFDDCFDSVETIISCGAHQKRIADDILTLSKLDSNLLIITPVRTRPLIILRDTLKLFAVEAQKAGVRLDFKADDSIEDLGIDWVYMDPSRVLQVVYNLLTNSIKFTASSPNRREVLVSIGASRERPSEEKSVVEYLPTGTVRDDITERSEWGDGEKLYIHFCVSDTGRGLSPGEQSKLFTRFSQGSRRTHVTYGGSGLGLFISRELTEMQGGEIGIRSEFGVGSTFSFYIKTRRCNPSSAIRENNYETATSLNEERGRRLSVPWEHMTILVVEDNIVNQKVLTKQLRALGCEVYVAGNGVEALDFIKRTTFWVGQEDTGLSLSMILLDVEMPIMDGLTCARRIRELQREGTIRSHIPIMAVSANARKEQIEETREAGIDDAIPKPFRISELIPKIQRLAAAGKT